MPSPQQVLGQIVGSQRGDPEADPAEAAFLAAWQALQARRGGHAGKREPEYIGPWIPENDREPARNGNGRH